MIFQLNHISKSYRNGERRLAVLTDVSLTVDSGEMLGISGPSGSGKTTLLNIMSLLDDGDGGEMVFMDQPTSTMGKKERSRFRLCHIGMVFQRFHLMTGLSVLENAMLPHWRLHGDLGAAKKRAGELLVRFGLKDRLQFSVEKISGGERQRTALARALVNDPQVVMADEPTGQLGPEQTIEIAQLFREICTEGKTVVVVSHNAEVLAQADRVSALKNGMLV